MKNKIRRLVLLLVVFCGGAPCLAVECTEASWDDALCRLEVWPGSRCANADNFRLFCAKDTDGCQKVPGGCIGATPTGHWYPIVENGAPRWRCRCGCFAEETLFAGSNVWSGSILLDHPEADVRLAVVRDFNTPALDLAPINGLMHSQGHEAMLWLQTRGGHQIVLSGAHPVVIADSRGRLLAMKQAQNVRNGEYLLEEGGRSDQVVAITPIDYTGRVMNFNVARTAPANHIVVANGLRLGDVGWQEQLNSTSSRLLYRTDIMQFIRQHAANNQ